MRKITELPAWERLFKRIVWEQIGDIEGKKILDFGSGEGITANHFAKGNEVIAIEPSEQMLKDAWTDYPYRQIIGDVGALSEFDDGYFDVIICHNVLEYIDDKKAVISELSRVLKNDGFISIAKHNRAGRVMQMAVLLDDFDKANALLDGHNSTASKFGTIRYYEDEDILKWEPSLNIPEVRGIRTFWDLQQKQELHEDEKWQEKMMRLERRVEKVPEYRNIAFFHHLILKKQQQVTVSDDVDLSIRVANADDSIAITKICKDDLGYDCDEQLVKRKLEAINQERECVFVAQLNGRVVGFIHVEIYDVLYHESMINVLGLAVSGDVRRKGVGTALMTMTQEYALQNGINEIRLNSGFSRNDAHEFYRKMEFDNEKTQLRFMKKVIKV